MSALMTETGYGVLTCNHSGRNAMDNDCAVEFPARPGEKVTEAEVRARAAGWVTIEAFGSVAHMCPQHA